MIDTLWTLPDGWEWVGLGNTNLVEIIMGQSPPSSTYNTIGEGLPFFQGKAEFGDLYPSPVKWCSSPTKIGLIGDILLSVRAPVGPTNLVKEKCCIGRGLAGLRPHKYLETLYLLYCLRCLETKIAGQGRGSAFNSISKTDIAKFKIPIPYPNNPKLSLNLQKRIVARIESLLGEIKKNRLLLEKMRLDNNELMDSALKEVFLLNNEFQQVPLNQKCHVIMGQSPSGKTYSNTPTGLPLLNGPKEFGIYHPTPIQWTSEPTKICEPEDLLICVRGATTGRTNWADQRYCIGRGIAAIRPQNKQNTDIRFIAHFIQSQANQILKAGRGSTFPNISKGDLENWKIPDISINDQKQLVSHFNFIQTETVKINLMLKEDEQNFNYLEQAILEKAFRGEL